MRQFNADVIVMAILKKDFLFMLAFMKEFLNLISPADKILQSRNVGLREAMPILNDVSSKIQKILLKVDRNVKS